MSGDSGPRPDTLGDLWHRFRWPIIAVVVVLLAAGARYEGTQAPEAMLLGLGVPALAAFRAYRPLRDSVLGLRRFAAAVALLTLLGSEALLVHVFFPEPPFATAHVSLKTPDASLEVPSGNGDFEVETHGTLAGTRSGSEERFAVTLERDGQKVQLEGEFVKSRAVRFSRRRAPTSTSAHVVDMEIDAVQLPGSGNVHAHLESLSGAGGKTLELRIRPSLPGARSIGLGLFVLLALALGVSLWARREGTRSRFLPWLAFGSALPLYLPRHFSPDDPLGAIVGALFVGAGAAIAGMLLAWFVGGFVTRRD